MLNFKTISVIILTIAVCSMASHASAQSTQTLEHAQPILSQPSITTKSTETERQVLPKGMSTRKVTRAVKPVPALASTSQRQHKNVYGGTLNANASKQKAQGRVYHGRRKDDSLMPVYSDKESIKSR